MTTKYSQWSAVALFALLFAGIAFKPQDAFASAAAAQAEGLHARVSDIRYQIDPDSPKHLAAVVLTFTPGQPAPASLSVRIPSHGAQWYSCRVLGSSWICATPDAPALADVIQIELAGGR